MLQARKKIGIMGGTFDPIHIGHLVTAEAARNEYKLDKVLFIPAGSPPHKQDAQVSSVLHRYIMTVMATYSNPYFQVLSLEMDRPGPSYTVDTVESLAAQYGKDVEIFFIVGADAVRDLPTWKDITRLLDMCHFVAAARPGCIGEIDNIIQYFGAKGRERIHRLTSPELEISATDIRERVKSGRSLKYIVPESVEQYIEKERLYQE